MIEWRLSRRFPRSRFFYVWNGYRYGSSGHFRLDRSLGSIRRSAKRYLRDGGHKVVIEIRPDVSDYRAPNAATITYSRWSAPVVELSQDVLP